MTKPCRTTYTCQHCGRTSTAESGFGRWMRNHPSLDSVCGIVRTDFDHIILRYKTSLQGRDFQLMMIVEVKEHGAEPDPCQLDILRFISQAIHLKVRNMHKATGDKTLRIKSSINGRMVRVKFFRVHLLQFENTNPDDSKWIKWDRKPISKEQLIGVLALERHPDKPSEWMINYLRDRHRQKQDQLMLQMQAA